jgi:hypothetical protein
MPRFLDSHSIPSRLTDETLKELQNAPVDEFGVKHVNIMYNRAENKGFCLLDAPNKEAVEKHHAKGGMKCDWIIEVKTTA